MCLYYKMSTGTVTPKTIPREVLSENEQVIYDSLTPAERDVQYKWWSMHDILNYYHAKSLFTIENEANFFNFKIDLTKPELTDMKYRDPNLVMGFTQTMDNLNDVTTAIANRFITEKAKFAQQQQDSTMNALSNRRGGKKRKQKGGIFNVDPNEDISLAFSKEKLREECMVDLNKDTFTSRNRIFVVDSLPLPLYTPPTLEVLKQTMEQTKAELAAQPGALMPGAAAPAAGGRGRRTRKSKKGRKHKTHRRRN
jgi:hypothetical protein